MRKLTKSEAEYFKQLMPYIVEVAKEDGIPATQDELNTQIKKAHDRFQDFICEMWEGRTERAKLARLAITKSVYTKIRSEAGVETKPDDVFFL